jgi:hypothetical protein
MAKRILRKSAKVSNLPPSLPAIRRHDSSELIPA